MTAEQERAAIVAYLRETKALHEANAPHIGKMVAKHHANACQWASEAIARGEHHIKG